MSGISTKRAPYFAYSGKASERKGTIIRLEHRHGEAAEEAIARAKTMPWADRVIDWRPFGSARYWCWVVKT